MGESSRHGLPADGWVKFSTQLPKDLAEQFRAIAGEAGAGGSKILTTVAISIIVNMNPEDRDALARYVVQKTWGGTKRFDPESVMQGMLSMLRESMLNAGEDGAKEWYIDRILDPEVTPEPGQKASERVKQKRKADGA